MNPEIRLTKKLPSKEVEGVVIQTIRHVDSVGVFVSCAPANKGSRTNSSMDSFSSWSIDPRLAGFCADGLADDLSQVPRNAWYHMFYGSSRW
jgi:hypothetical protein